MSVRDLISAAYNKDAASFESTLHAVMQEKMAAAIQSRFSPAVYEEEVDLEEAKKHDEEDEDEEDEMCEDLDQIDEISKPTVVSYLKKAQQSKDDASGQVFKGAAMGAPANDPKTLSKRNKGMDIGIRKIVGNVKVPATEK